LFDQAKSSVTEIVIAALSALKGIARFDWGIRALHASKNFEMLFDKKGNSSKVCNDWKYSVLEQILAHSETENVFGKVELDRISKMVKSGPNAYEFVPIVATETG
jgi:flagellar motor switch protein FliG